MKYDPEKNYRKSIRLKGHDYAGGGLYFVTLCAHREFVEAAQGDPFGANGATQGARQASPVRDLIEERMRITAEKCPFMKWEAAVIMPDHFHALIRVEGGHAPLGDVIGGFKAAVSREIRRGDTCVAPDVRIWHRNYYEMIVRTPEAEKNITEYIRLNPWRCITDFGNGLRGMGNPALWNAEKLGMLCSRNAPKGEMDLARTHGGAVLSGFHSPMEKEILTKLLELEKPIIWCPAWGLVGAGPASPILTALEENRMLVLEMRNRDGDLAAAKQRNEFVMNAADRLWLPHMTPGGMLDGLIRTLKVQGKVCGEGKR